MDLKNLSWLFALMAELKDYPDPRVGLLIEATLQLESQLDACAPRLAAANQTRMSLAQCHRDIQVLLRAMEREGAFDQARFPQTYEHAYTLGRLIGWGDETID
ncbi:MAG: hypothetical protein HC837_19700 [Chloroflexaceae bacterium]|nr:hypothetical protein [Chloroflexaceae bacterium]